MLGALMIHGLRPGPMLFSTHPDFVWGLIASMYIGNIMLLILNMPLIGMWVQVLKVPYNVLFPLILMFCVIGVFASSNQAFDVLVMAIFGVLGYLFRKFGYEWPRLQREYAALSPQADVCVECKSCETNCPFDLPIVERIHKLHERLSRIR